MLKIAQKISQSFSSVSQILSTQHARKFGLG